MAVPVRALEGLLAEWCFLLSKSAMEEVQPAADTKGVQTGCGRGGALSRLTRPSSNGWWTASSGNQ